MKMPANMPSSVFFCLLQPSGTKAQASDSTRPQRCSTAPPANDLFLERMSCKMALGQVTCKMYVAVILPQRQSDLYEAWKLNVLELKVLPASVKAGPPSQSRRRVASLEFKSLARRHVGRHIYHTSKLLAHGTSRPIVPAVLPKTTHTTPSVTRAISRQLVQGLACKHVGGHF